MQPRLHDVAPRAGAERLGDVVAGFVHRQEHDARARSAALELERRLESVEARHRDVEHDQIGIRARRRVERPVPVHRRADHVEALGDEL